MTISEIFTRLINAVTANSNKLKEIADKLEQLEVGAGGGGSAGKMMNFGKSRARMTQGGLTERAAERIRLTPRGMQVMNGILVAMLEESENRS